MSKIRAIIRSIVEILKSDDADADIKADVTPADEPKDEPKDDKDTASPQDDASDAEPKDDNPAPDIDPVAEPKEPAKGVDLDNPERRLVTTMQIKMVIL